MLRRLTVQAFAKNETSGWVAGAGWLVWRLRPDLGGLILWGHQGEAEARAVAQICNDGLGARRTPLAPSLSVLDLRRASAFDLSAFFAFDRWLVAVNSAHPELSVAVLSDRSPACAALFGLIQLAAPRIMHAHYAEVEALLAEAQAPAGLLAELDGIVESLQSPREALRATLRASHGRLSLRRAARQIGRSVRGLQRELERDGTTFERERSEVRRQVFEALVADPTLKLDAVAAQLGFPSLRVFSTAFRRAVGLSPRAFRAQAAACQTLSSAP